jgi:D-3-phosphoglycerate dehydrogenase
VVLLNFARGGLVDSRDLKNAIREGIVSWYITDFPDKDLLSSEQVLSIPHLGASSREAEINCAIMAVDQIRDFLETGNIKNSVNLPDCAMEKTGKTRITIVNRNIPNMVGQITTVLAEEEINISDMLNRHKDNYAYTIIDVEGDIPQESIENIRKIDGVIRVRLLT